MAKNKKQKTKHLSQAEIWDDSALIRSWDEAVAEYEYYHSLHARGEDIQAVLDAAEAEERGLVQAINGKSDSNEAGGRESVLEDGELNLEDGADVNVEDGDMDENEVLLHETVSKEEAHGSDDTQMPEENIPKQSPEQLLENIKMAYWWAGYYSGLYEAQQHAATQKP